MTTRSRRRRTQAAPRLNWVVTLQRQETARDSSGGVVTTWKDGANLWAHVNVTGVSENFSNNASRAIPLRSAQITIRWSADVSETDRVIHDGLPWDIKGIAEIGYRRGLTLYCQTDVSRKP